MSFNLLKGKKGIIFGALNEQSIAWKVAERAVEEGSVEEELRLFYVAITRARKYLYLLRAKERMQRGITRATLPSPFLHLLTDEVAERPTPEELLRPASEDEVRQAFANIFKMLKSDQ